MTIAKPFAVGVYEITLAEWVSCQREGRCKRNPNRYSMGDGSDHPVENIRWSDAQTYVAWLSSKTGKRYRLLSESEWEYVARAGTTTRYWWGDSLGRGQASCYHCGGRWSVGDLTAPVGSFSPNPFGLFDVHGNVPEWVEDCWHRSYAGAPVDGSAWTSGGDCRFRIVRGGSYFGNWLYAPRGWLRSAARKVYDSKNSGVDAGIRVARWLD